MALDFDFTGSFGYSTTVLDYASIASGGWTIESSGGRAGRACIRGTAQNGWVDFPLKISTDTKYFHFAVKMNWFPSSPGRLACFKRAGLIMCRMNVDSSGGVSFFNGNSQITAAVPGCLTLNVWTHFQVKVVFHGSTGSIEMRINGSSTSILNATNINTAENGGTVCDALELNTDIPGSFAWDYCDIAVTRSGFLGDKAVQYFKPNGAGSSAQWTGVSGANDANVDEATKDTADYNETSTVGDKDTFAMEDVVVPSVIDAVVPVILADRQDAGAATLAAVIRHSGTDYDQTAFSPNFGSITYNKPDYLETNPGTGSAWVDTDVNAMELGYKRAS